MGIGGGKSQVLTVINITGLHPSIGSLDVLRKAAEVFKDTPGVHGKNKLLSKVLENCKNSVSFATARGAMYELEKGLELIRNGEQIIEFGAILERADKYKREFDIILRDRVIECKNINWIKYTGDSAEEMRKTFGLQASIAREHGKIFEVHSKQLVPEEWKQWFARKGIKVFEG